MTKPAGSDELVKIAFPLNEAERAISGSTLERLWASPVSKDRFVLENSPFSIYGISWQDTVLARRRKGELTFVRVLARGGHSTYRVRLPEGGRHDDFMVHWPELEAFGCTFEGIQGEQPLYSIDVPDMGVVQAVWEILQAKEDAGLWEFEEAHYFRADELSRA